MNCRLLYATPCSYAGSVARISKGNFSNLRTSSDDEELMAKLIQWGHHEPLEFIDFIWEVNCPDFVLAYLARHRIGVSKVVESLRYTKVDSSSPICQEDNKDISEGILQAHRRYLELLDKGVAPEEARKVLPQGINRHLVIKMNGRSFMHFWKLRSDKHAHPDVQKLARMMMETLENRNTTAAYAKEVKG